jgi:formiminoglutamase
MKLNNWQPVSEQQFFSRSDPHDLRWGDFVQAGTPWESAARCNFGLWGYADDDGIALNGGRIGARFAPEFIRRFFYRTTPATMTSKPALLDYGNWTPATTLAEQLTQLPPLLAGKLMEHPMVTLGGGHDYGAVDGAGFLQWCIQHHHDTKPLVINFDAHLDVRPWSKGLNSGTPFSWLIDHFPNQFDFIEVGIQKHCSSPDHHAWARNQNAQILSLDFVQSVGVVTALRQVLAGTSPQQPCFISLDIDVLSQSQAPGSSQSWVAGLQYHELVAAMQWLHAHKMVRLLGIYEVSPPLDSDHQTSKLAACLVDSFLRMKMA